MGMTKRFHRDEKKVNSLFIWLSLSNFFKRFLPQLLTFTVLLIVSCIMGIDKFSDEIPDWLAEPRLANTGYRTKVSAAGWAELVYRTNITSLDSPTFSLSYRQKAWNVWHSHFYSHSFYMSLRRFFRGGFVNSIGLSIWTNTLTYIRLRTFKKAGPISSRFNTIRVHIESFDSVVM